MITAPVASISQLESQAGRRFSAPEKIALGAQFDAQHHGHKISLAAIASRKELDVGNDDWPRTGGACVRDHVHIQELGHAHRLSNTWTGTASFLACDLGVGRGFGIGEVLNEDARITGRIVSIRPASRRNGDPPTLWPAPESVMEWLGWQPRHIALDLIIDRAWRWYRQLLR